MFTFASKVTNDSTLLWLTTTDGPFLRHKCCFAKMFTNGTRVHMVPMVTFATMLTKVNEIPVATVVTNNSQHLHFYQDYQFCNHNKPTIWVRLVTMITGVAIVCTGTLINTIYHCNLRNLVILGDHGRRGIHNNQTNLVPSVRKGTTGT
jgi:hypothetical protein